MNDPPQDDVASQIADLASELKDLGLEEGVSKELTTLIERGLHSTKLAKPLKGAKAAESFQRAFEIIGGIPRLALWADKNLGRFYTLYARMIPTTINPISEELATNNRARLDDMPWVSAQRLAYRLHPELAQVALDVEAKVKD